MEKSIKIGNIELKNKFILAPMAGYTAPGFRRLMAENGAALTVTEMISIKGLMYENQKTNELLKTDKSEHIKCVQLFGNNPQDFVRAASLPALKKFDIIDINMGCPVRKIVQNAEGSALINHPKTAQEIVSSLKDIGKTVTVKTRLGIKSAEKAVEFALLLQEAGADMITIHARTQAQMYQGQVDYDTVAQIKNTLSIPIAFSGDIVDIDSLKKAETTKADYYMIGRGALYNPDIFNEFLGRATIGKKVAINRLLGYLIDDFGESHAIKVFRKFLPYLLKNCCSRQWRHSLNFISDIIQLKAELDKVPN